MTDKARIKIAALVTALFLAGASAVGLATHQHTPGALPPAPAAVVQPPAVAPAPQLSPGADESAYEHEDSAGEAGDD
jgi:hypothetical protein